MPDMGEQIIGNARELGAAMAGIANVGQLKASPTSEFLRREGTKVEGVYWKPEEQSLSEVRWPARAQSALVIAISHPPDRPELDYWSDAAGGTPGNRILMDINRELSSWIEKTFGIGTHRMPYHVESGGIYLKDAAVLAGLGCIGRNNILITPALGPRIRLRGLLLEAELTPNGPIDFDPCDGCKEYCRRACPQSAFGEQVYVAEKLRMTQLPGRDGTFSRAGCKVQMDRDAEEPAASTGTGRLASLGHADDAPQEKRVAYCRQCEFACPVGGR